MPPAIRRALEHRDGGCRFPGCGNRYADAHHILHWADGGETKLSNLVLLCRRCHRAVHEEGFRVEAGENGELRFRRPDGRPIPMVPDPPPLPEGAGRELEREQARMGILPDPWTATPLWHGERLDYGLALDMFRVGDVPAGTGTEEEEAGGRENGIRKVSTKGGGKVSTKGGGKVSTNGGGKASPSLA